MARYEALKDPMVARKQKLADSLRLQQLFRDVEDEETWIREKEPIAASTNRGWYILSFCIQLGEHQIMELSNQTVSLQHCVRLIKMSVVRFILNTGLNYICCSHC